MNYAPLTLADDAWLHWRQPGSWDRRFVLQAEDRHLGSLEYTSSLKNTAIAETAVGRWSFEPQGFWKPQIVVYRDGVTLASLEVTNVWMQNRAVLSAVDGAPIAVWEMASMLRGFVEWRAADGGPLIQYRMGTDEGGMANWIRTQCRVDFAADGFTHPERDLLVCLGWHMTVLAMNPAI